MQHQVEIRRKVVLQILERRVLECLHLAPKQQEKMSLKAVQEYFTHYLPTIFEGMGLHVKWGFLILLVDNVALSETEALRQQTLRGMEGYHGSNDTKRGLIKRVHHFFVFCNHRGWISLNPAAMIIEHQAEGGCGRDKPVYPRRVYANDRPQPQNGSPRICTVIGFSGRDSNANWRDDEAALVGY